MAAGAGKMWFFNDKYSESLRWIHKAMGLGVILGSLGVHALDGQVLVRTITVPLYEIGDDLVGASDAPTLREEPVLVSLSP